MKKHGLLKLAAVAVIAYLVFQKQKSIPLVVTQYIPSGLVSPPVPIGF